MARCLLPVCSWVLWRMTGRHTCRDYRSLRNVQEILVPASNLPSSLLIVVLQSIMSASFVAERNCTVSCCFRSLAGHRSTEPTCTLQYYSQTLQYMKECQKVYAPSAFGPSLTSWYNNILYISKTRRNLDTLSIIRCRLTGLISPWPK